MLWRVFAGVALVASAVLLAAFGVASAALGRSSETAARRGLEQSADLVAQLLAGRTRGLAGGARVFVKNPAFRSLVLGGRRDDLLDQAAEAAEQLEADWVIITDARGAPVARSDVPAASDAAVDRALVAGALRGQYASGYGVTRGTVLYQAVAVPITGPGDQADGVLVATRVLDAQLARDARALTGSEVAFFARDAPGGEARVVLSTMRGADAVAAALSRLAPGVAASRTRVAIGGEEYLGHAGALAAAGGQVVGGFVALRARAPVDARRSLLVPAALGLALVLGAAYGVACAVVRRDPGVDPRPPAIGRAAADAPTSAASSAAPSAAPSGASSGASSAAPAGAGVAPHSPGDDASLVAAVAATLAADTGRPPAAQPTPDPAPIDGDRRALRLFGGARAAAARGHVVAGRYVVQDVVGAGGYATVYTAADAVVGELVALKLFGPDVAAGDPSAAERLQEELADVRLASHRNIVRVYGAGLADGVPYYTMEYVDGVPLAALIAAHGRLPTEAVFSVARQLVGALEAAHAQDAVHGDVKPHNVLVDRAGTVKLADFGVAGMVRRAAGGAAREAPGADGTAVVGRLAGAVVGTPQYMPPEQLLGLAPTALGDIYAAGVVLYECLTGVTPYQSDTPVRFMAHKLGAWEPGGAPAAAGAADGPDRDARVAALERLLAQMTTADPTRRPPTANAVATALAEAELTTG